MMLTRLKGHKVRARGMWLDKFKQIQFSTWPLFGVRIACRCFLRIFYYIARRWFRRPSEGSALVRRVLVTDRPVSSLCSMMPDGGDFSTGVSDLGRLGAVPIRVLIRRKPIQMAVFRVSEVRCQRLARALLRRSTAKGE